MNPGCAEKRGTPGEKDSGNLIRQITILKEEDFMSKAKIFSNRMIFRIAIGIAAAVISQNGPAAAQNKLDNAVRMVANPSQPKNGLGSPKLTELWSVGGEKDPSGELLNRPFEIKVATDGTVYVLDRGDTCIRSFDASGKFIRQIGRKGQGPGDIETLCWFDLDSQGRIYVLDWQNKRVSRFERDGKFLGSFRLEKFAAQIRIDPSGRIFCGEKSRGTEALSSEFRRIEQTLSIARYAPDGGSSVRIGPFPADPIIMKAQGESVMSLSSPQAPQTGWGIDPEGRLWAGFNGAYEIGVFDPDGKPLFRFGREFKPVKNKALDKLTIQNRKTTTLPEFLPAFVQDFFFDEKGNAWFRMYRNEEDKDEPYRYDVFSPEGVYLRQIAVPFKIYQVRNGKMYAIVETEDGFKTLKCYQFQI